MVDREIRSDKFSFGVPALVAKLDRHKVLEARPFFINENGVDTYPQPARLVVLASLCPDL